VVLPTTAGLPGWLLCAGATTGEPPVVMLAVGDGVGVGDWLGLCGGMVAAGGGGGGATGAAVVGTGTVTDETWDEWETCETCPSPEPDT
jgi:hypothetical protein